VAGKTCRDRSHGRRDPAPRPAPVAGHPAVNSVEFAGSRSRGTLEELSDWEFAVTTSDLDALVRDPPTLVAPLEPLSQRWEPMGHFPVYQVLLRGPIKIEYLFLDRSQDPTPSRTPSLKATAAINTHVFVACRDALEERLDITVGRALENEVRQAMRRVLRP
jgi:hypothetical protein